MLTVAPSICSRCNGSGWVPVGDAAENRVEPCGCQGDLRRQQRIASANIPKRYAHCTLETFRERSTASVKSAKRKALEFVDVWPHARRGLLLSGPCGSGKTHLAVAVLLEIINNGGPGRVLFCNFQDLIQEIHASFDDQHPTTKFEILRPVLEADLLVLDELGSVKPTQFVQDTLYYVINTRYNEERTTIFTTNYLDSAADSKDETLEQRIGTRLRSRLHEMTDPIVISGVSDYRKDSGI